MDNHAGCSSYSLEKGDVIETIRKYPQKFQLIVADPPFNIGYNKGSHHCNTAGSLLYKDNYSKEEYQKFSDEWISACEQALAPNGSIYIASGWNCLHSILDAVEKTQLTMVNHAIWYFDFGVFQKKKYTNSHYHILFLVKNPTDYTFIPQHRSSPTSEPYEEDVWHWQRGKVPYRINKKVMGDEEHVDGHPCQIPSFVIEKMLSISSKQGDWVGDVFSGSGTTSLVCRKMERNVIAFEKNSDYFDVIYKKAKFGQPIARTNDSITSYFH